MIGSGYALKLQLQPWVELIALSAAERRLVWSAPLNVPWATNASDCVVIVSSTFLRAALTFCAAVAEFSIFVSVTVSWFDVSNVHICDATSLATTYTSASAGAIVACWRCMTSVLMICDGSFGTV